VRILAALDGTEFEPAVVGLAALAAEHELVISCGGGHRGLAGNLLELALRNALPGRDVTTVVTEVVVSPDDPAIAFAEEPAAVVEPHAIAELRSLRVLVESGAVVICVGGVPVTVDAAGRMRAIEAVIDDDLTAALLARRLDADLLLMLAGPEQLDSASGPIGSKAEAARRFAAATGRRAAVGDIAEAAPIARGEAGTQVAPALLCCG
jgi:carbamate kinase